MSARPKVVVITGASSGFGNLTARALAEAGHIVYAGMRATTGRNAPAVAALARVGKDRGVRIPAVEMDVQDQESIDAAVDHVMAEHGRIDVVVHNAGHMVARTGRGIHRRSARRRLRRQRAVRTMVSTMYDRIRAEFFHRVGIGELLTPRASL